MALSRDAKTAQVADLTQKFQTASSVMFSHYLGLTVADVSSLRRKLKEKKAEMKVAKKTLINIAAKNAGKPEVADDVLNGAIACIFSYEDPTAGAQTAFAFAKDHPQVKLVGGMFEGSVLDAKQALAFAKMPGREQLLATFMSMLRSPLQSFASICSSPLRGFAVAVSEIAKQKESSPA
jgi:large subunit ribosomal protein L10